MLIAPMPLLGHVDPKELNKDLNTSCKPLAKAQIITLHRTYS